VDRLPAIIAELFDNPSLAKVRRALLSRMAIARVGKNPFTINDIAAAFSGLS
jgi:hypothetical protein